MRFWPDKIRISCPATFGTVGVKPGWIAITGSGNVGCDSGMGDRVMIGSGEAVEVGLAGWQEVNIMDKIFIPINIMDECRYLIRFKRKQQAIEKGPCQLRLIICCSSNLLS